MPVIPSYVETAADATHSFGTRLAWGPFVPASPDNFFLISDVKELAIAGRKLSEIDVSHFLSPGKWKEFIAGFGDSGNVTFKTNFSDAQLDVLEALVPEPTDANFGRVRWVIVTPAGGTIAFVGFLQPPNPTFPDDGAIMIDCSIRVSGIMVATPP